MCPTLVVNSCSGAIVNAKNAWPSRAGSKSQGLYTLIVVQVHDLYWYKCSMQKRIVVFVSLLLHKLKYMLQAPRKRATLHIHLAWLASTLD